MFGLFEKPARMWRFETLADFAGVLRWKEARRRKAHGLKALGFYLRETTSIIRRSIDRYQQRVEQLDALCGGILSDPASAQRAGLDLPPGVSILENLQRLAGELRTYFDQLLGRGEGEFLSQWRRSIGSGREYRFLLKRLVGDFGNFEVLLPTLPGTGPVITDRRTQQCLEDMYQINTRNLRILELIHGLNKAWNAKPTTPNYAFFKPRTDLRQTIGGILREYLVHADPVRIRAKWQAEEHTGRRHVPYRFWRAAENLRLMANVTYPDDRGREPVIRRRYVDARMEHVPPICTDIHRLAWAMKEIFNNSLSASSHMYAGPAGQWIARPLDRHAVSNPDPAIRMRLKHLRRRRGLRKRSTLRLTVLDEGRGIDPEHLTYVTLWGYSPRREEFRTRVQQAELTQVQARREIRIGGKGIGLAYASAVAREHGGELKITSTPGEGTCVTVELPVPTPLRV